MTEKHWAGLINEERLHMDLVLMLCIKKSWLNATSFSFLFPTIVVYYFYSFS